MKDYNKKIVKMADSLEKLATLICGYGSFAYHNDDWDYPIRKEAVMEYLEMGADFQKEQLMKAAVECEVLQDEVDDIELDTVGICPDGLILDKTKFIAGDKIKEIIIPSQTSNLRK